MRRFWHVLWVATETVGCQKPAPRRDGEEYRDRSFL